MKDESNIHVREIPSAGPWITQKEQDYVADAVAHGWYANWSGYLDRFEKKMAEFTHSRHAILTSSCTGALHIAMSVLGLKTGDEVIVPDVTWIATATCVCYLGATPVFVDVEPDTWCMDPKALEAAITPRTKAVIPVHMYGHIADMKAINRIATDHGIAVIEDAAPGIGSRYDNRPAGSFGLAATFSFQGAKPLVTGEGGCLVTDDDDFYERAYWYWDHCRDKNATLFNTGIGYKYKMSNIQAALGLAQVERAKEIIEKRRQIFFWYRDRLSNIPGLRMNAERPGHYNNFYVPTIILEGDFAKTAQELMDELDRRKIRNRPFFRRISHFPMFEPIHAPVADHLAENGVNLPCPTLLTEDDVDWVAKNVREILLG
jgi:perosamine synthetase